MLRTNSRIIHETDFPFNIFNAHGLSASQLANPTIHRHDCLEINYIVSGKGCYLFGEQKYELHPGDIYIINNQEYHMAYNTGDLFLKVITFDAALVWNGSRTDYMYLKAFFDRNDKDSPYLDAEQPVTKDIAAIIQNIEDEWLKKEPGYQILIKADLMKILGMIYRHYEEVERFENRTSHPWGNHHSVIRVVDYINTHYQKRLSLKEMADMVHMSENHFSSLFSEIMQLPFSRYVLEKRLHEACLLLKTTDHTITDIALMTGFDTISYFNRAFKNNYKVSPGKYRASIQDQKLPSAKHDDRESQEDCSINS